MQEKVQFFLIYDNAPNGPSFQRKASLPSLHNLGSPPRDNSKEPKGQGVLE
jgi:hypothetical protein